MDKNKIEFPAPFGSNLLGIEPPVQNDGDGARIQGGSGQKPLDTMLPEAIAALFTSKGPVLRLFVLIYFKLGEAVGDMAMVPLASMGREEGGALFLR